MKSTGLTILVIIITTFFLFLISTMIIGSINDEVSSSIRKQYVSGGSYSDSNIRGYASGYGAMNVIMTIAQISLILFVDVKIWQRHKKLTKDEEK